jgi:hypothetical protein
MPRPRSITIPVARVSAKVVERIEEAMRLDPKFIPSEAQAKVIFILARAQAVLVSKKDMAGEDDDERPEEQVKAGIESLEKVRDAWEQARLRYKLFPHQRPAYDEFKARITNPDPEVLRTFALQWPRRAGKTFEAELIGVETCLKILGARGVVIAPTEEMLEEYVIPAITLISLDAPPHMRPKWVKSDGKFYFDHNGSHIALYGAKDDAAIEIIGRGPAAHYIIYEEAGAIRNLPKLRDVVSPQLLSNMATDHAGWQLFVGTPPETTAHEFVKLCRAYARTGQLSKLTIWDTHHKREIIEKWIAERADGMPREEFIKTETFRREFLAEFISDPTRKVLKLANEKYLEACQERYRQIYRSGGRPSHFTVGWKPDWTFWLIAWWHHQMQTLVVEAERYWRDGFTPEAVAEAVIEEEKKLLGPERRAPFKYELRAPSRWSDYSPILLSELSSKHGLEFSPTRKDDRDTAISDCDRMIPGFSPTVGALAINPACSMLLQQMDAAIWAKGGKHKEFARDDIQRYGHYDGVAALVYLTRNVVRTENPVPEDWGVPQLAKDHFDWRPPQGADRAEEEKWGRVFGMDPREVADREH